MKKRLTSLIVGVTALLTTHSALALRCDDSNDFFDGFYVAATGSATWHNDMQFGVNIFDYKTSGAGALAVGAIIDSWRLEIEAAFRRNKIDSATTSGLAITSTGYNSDFSLMMNPFYDFHIWQDLWLYAGGGLGVSLHEFTLTEYAGSPVSRSKHNTRFAWQLMAGLSFYLTDHVALFGGYRFFATTKVKNASNLESKKIPYSHNADLGIRFEF